MQEKIIRHWLIITLTILILFSCNNNSSNDYKYLENIFWVADDMNWSISKISDNRNNDFIDYDAENNIILFFDSNNQFSIYNYPIFKTSEDDSLRLSVTGGGRYGCGEWHIENNQVIIEYKYIHEQNIRLLDSIGNSILDRRYIDTILMSHNDSSLIELIFNNENYISAEKISSRMLQKLNVIKDEYCTE